MSERGMSEARETPEARERLLGNGWGGGGCGCVGQSNGKGGGRG